MLTNESHCHIKDKKPSLSGALIRTHYLSKAGSIARDSFPRLTKQLFVADQVREPASRTRNDVEVATTGLACVPSVTTASLATTHWSASLVARHSSPVVVTTCCVVTAATTSPWVETAVIPSTEMPAPTPLLVEMIPIASSIL